MSPRKLTDATKTEILKLYRETEATTSTLAERYGVSSSTISRFLKNSFTEGEYEELIQRKRLARVPKNAGEEEVLESEPIPEEGQQLYLDIDTIYIPEKQELAEINREIAVSGERVQESPSDNESDNESEGRGDVSTLKQFFGDEIGEDDEDDWEDDEDDEDDDETERVQILPNTTQLQVLPVSAATFPKTCYLVIDRASELITRPLKDFEELGRVPTTENQQRTLPVFDSHRIARRFSKRREKVIRIPDGKILQKTIVHLKAKGITRLLMDGRIYSLFPN